VFEAHAKCEHLRRWWGPRGHAISECRMEFRPGGAWRIVQRTPTGQEHAFRGQYREIVAPERIVWTFEYEGLPGHVCVETLSFEEKDGVTTLTSTSVFDSVEDRNGLLQGGMESGATESMERLGELLEELTRAPG
jgi:uncharacterized protein YndB with AHSA1/START domain